MTLTRAGSIEERVVSASDERSGALTLSGELLPVAPCYVDIFSRKVSPQPLSYRDFMQKTVHASPTSTGRESSGYISPSAGSVGPLRSWRATGSHLFGLPDSNRLVVRESPGLPVREGCGYICAVFGDARSFCSELVTESYLVVSDVRVELVLRKLRWLLKLLLWTDFSRSHIFRTRW